MFFVHPYLSPVCVWHRGLEKSSKKRKDRVTTTIPSWRGVNRHRLLARAQWREARQRPGASPTETEDARGQTSVSVGPQNKRREAGSEAEGKIEADFLAGVEIIDGQMN